MATSNPKPKAPERRRWAPAELQQLQAAYANTPTAELARALGRPSRSVYAKAYELGLAKAPELVAQIARQRTMEPGHGSEGTRFEPGQQPWNLGVKGVCGTHPNCRPTQFKQGQCSGRAAQLLQPIGTLRINADGVLERKVTSLPGAPHLRWHPVHRLVWVATHGPVPAGCIVVFKPGRRTAELERITLDALELVTRTENMRRNGVHSKYPPEVARLVQLRGALTRQINRKAKEQSKP
jgi:hypothetical protein